MARRCVTAAIVVLLAVCVGCRSTDPGGVRQLPYRTGPVIDQASPDLLEGKTEADLVEQLNEHRMGYRRALELLIRHYESMGNHENRNWAQKELTALNSMPQYSYIPVPDLVDSTLRASVAIPEADALYAEAVAIHRKAEPLIVLKDEELLRQALRLYGQVIRLHPTSDKIDDCAYKSGTIHEYFRDYTNALSYFQRAYQWDVKTPYPARFRAAFLLDKMLHRRAEALALYQIALEVESGHKEWVEYTNQRIRELTASE